MIKLMSQRHLIKWSADNRKLPIISTSNMHSDKCSWSDTHYQQPCTGSKEGQIKFNPGRIDYFGDPNYGSLVSINHNKRRSDQITLGAAIGYSSGKNNSNLNTPPKSRSQA